MQQKHLSPQAWAELILLGVIWGASFVSIRIALDEVPVLTTVLHRTFWAMCVLWMVVFLQRLPLPRTPEVWLAFLVMGLLNNVLPFGLMAWGQLHIESGLTSILNATTAIFGVIVAAALFRDERLTPRRVIGVVLGFLGVATAIGLHNLTNLDLKNSAQIAVLAGAFSYACAGAWARVRLSHLPPQIAAAGMLSGSTAVLLPATLMFEGVPAFDLQPVTWIAIGYYSLVATAGAYLLYYRVLSTAGSGNLMLVTLIIPPVAIVLGLFLRNESLSPQAFGGFALLAAGLIILKKSGRNRN